MRQYTNINSLDSMTTDEVLVHRFGTESIIAVSKNMSEAFIEGLTLLPRYSLHIGSLKKIDNPKELSEAEPIFIQMSENVYHPFKNDRHLTTDPNIQLYIVE